MKFRVVLPLFVLLSLPSALCATPVIWTLSGATLIDGGSLTGSFILDADTETSSAWDFLFPADPTAEITGGELTPANNTLIEGNENFFVVKSHTDGDMVGLLLVDLTDAGGTFNLSRSEVYNESPSNPNDFVDSFTSGWVSSDPTFMAPEPASWLLLCSAGLLPLAKIDGWQKRRRRTPPPFRTR